jgi:hypothetical protein
MSNPSDKFEGRVERDWHEGSISLPREAERALEQAVNDFVRSWQCPPDRYTDEWRTECRNEAWCCLPDVLRTYEPERGSLAGYVYRAVLNHLQDYLQREKRPCQTAGEYILEGETKLS